MTGMDALLSAIAMFLLLNVCAGLVRVVRGPRNVDRMQAALLFGSTTVAILLVMAEAGGRAALRDVALLFVLLATILSVAFVGLPPGRDGDDA
ncbi:monovalent cation/H+ antiporter complex subunit F [Luteimonas aestuarii]|nr:monovalent cation/H+ antiporter complex subunit F [Luteimonas aestuarii]